MPRVSVNIPSYNHTRPLRLRIKSVLRQTYQDLELILLDDCSTDEGRSILFEYPTDPRVRLEFNEKNSGGASKRWNKGVRQARGQYIWIAE
jgi:glycosyltransferase involved in cell wall biosynthesis